MASLTLSHLQTHSDPSTEDNSVAKGEIASTEQILLLSRCYKLNSLITQSFRQIFHIFTQIFSKLSVADLLYVGNGSE